MRKKAKRGKRVSEAERKRGRIYNADGLVCQFCV
jgi:hypothetical protein